MEKKARVYTLVLMLEKEEMLCFKRRLKYSKKTKAFDRKLKIIYYIEGLINSGASMKSIDNSVLATLTNVTDIKHLDSIYTQLIYLLENFTIELELKQNEEHRFLILTEILKKRKSSDYLALTLSQYAKGEKKPKTLESREYYTARAKLFKEMYEHPSTQPRSISALENLKKSQSYSITYSNINAMLYLCKKASRGLLIRTEHHSVKELPGIDNLPLQEGGIDSFSLNLLKESYTLVFSSDIESFQMFIQSLNTSKDYVSNEVLETIFELTLACLAKFEPDKSYRLLYDLYRFAFNSGLLVGVDGRIELEDLSNLLVLAFKNKDLEFVADLESEYDEFIDPTQKKDFKNIIHAYNYYYHGNYDRVLKQLELTSTKNLTRRFSLQHQILAIQSLLDATLFHTDKSDQLLFKLDEFEAILNKNKGYIANSTDIRNQNFIDIVKACLLIRDDQNLRKKEDYLCTKLRALYLKVSSNSFQCVQKDCLLKTIERFSLFINPFVKIEYALA